MEKSKGLFSHFSGLVRLIIFIIFIVVIVFFGIRFFRNRQRSQQAQQATQTVQSEVKSENQREQPNKSDSQPSGAQNIPSGVADSSGDASIPAAGPQVIPETGSSSVVLTTIFISATIFVLLRLRQSKQLLQQL